MNETLFDKKIIFRCDELLNVEQNITLFKTKYYKIDMKLTSNILRFSNGNGRAGERRQK